MSLSEAFQHVMGLALELLAELREVSLRCTNERLSLECLVSPWACPVPEVEPTLNADVPGTAGDDPKRSCPVQDFCIRTFTTEPRSAGRHFLS